MWVKTVAVGQWWQVDSVHQDEENQAKINLGGTPHTTVDEDDAEKPASIHLYQFILCTDYEQ